jgi:hypothetical protein
MALTSSNHYFKYGSTRRYFPAMLDGHRYTWVKPRTIRRGLYSGNAFSTTGKRWQVVTATLLVSYTGTGTSVDPDSQAATKGGFSDITSIIDAATLYYANPESNTYRQVLVSGAEIGYSYDFDPAANYSIVVLTLEDVVAT